MAPPERLRHRIERRSGLSLQVLHDDKPRHHGERITENVVVDCGWGRLLFAHTFPDERTLAETLCQETGGRRDIAMYLRDPHVVLSLAPQELFLDPSHTYRLWMSNYLPGRVQPRGFRIRRLQQRSDTDAINELWTARQMVPVEPEFIWQHRRSKVLRYFVAEDTSSGAIIGTVMGVDHSNAFDDPENGSSLWCLAVDPQAAQPGIGRALVAHLADFFAARGRAFMDLSVMYDNEHAIQLYEKMGFQRVPVFSLKRKNPINERLFIGPAPEQQLNPYASIIVNEARRRGISVEVLDAAHGYFALGFGGRRIVCRESLSELTSAVAMSRCANKTVTHGVLQQAGLRVPRFRIADSPEENKAFLKECGKLVIKPADGEQGRGVRVGVSTARELASAVRAAGQDGDEVLLEEFIEGRDLRVIVIDYAVVAAAIRRPPQITGNGTDTIRTLIEKLSRRRESATGGESRIPVDAATRRCVRRAGHDFDDVLPSGDKLQVRDTANLHTGGTIHDVTDKLHPRLAEVAAQAARALAIPVVGLDLMVPSIEGEEYVIIEANERPGLANHEPQPTAERFIDLLFPQTRVKMGEAR